MAARSPQRPGAEFFIAPGQVNQRRYEALRAYFVDGLSYAEAGARFGYTRGAQGLDGLQPARGVVQRAGHPAGRQHRHPLPVTAATEPR